MGTLSVSDITRILQISSIIVAGLLILLILFRTAIRILRHVLKKAMALNNSDLIGQKAVVRRTVRSQRPGEIECEWKGQLLSGPAVSDTTIKPGRPVLIYAADQDCYKVRLIEYDYLEGSYESTDNKSEW